jgi:hypothetical protein
MTPGSTGSCGDVYLGRPVLSWLHSMCKEEPLGSGFRGQGLGFPHPGVCLDKVLTTQLVSMDCWYSWQTHES